MGKKSALSQKNILEHRERECKRAIQRNRSMGKGALQTRPATLQRIVVVNPEGTESK